MVPARRIATHICTDSKQQVKEDFQFGVALLVEEKTLHEPFVFVLLNVSLFAFNLPVCVANAETLKNFWSSVSPVRYEIMTDEQSHPGGQSVKWGGGRLAAGGRGLTVWPL